MKKVGLFIVVLLGLLFYGCNEIKENATIKIFNAKEATEVAKEYMSAIALGDFEVAEELSSKRIKNDGEIKNINTDNINGYKLDLSMEGADHAYFTFKIIKEEKNNGRVDLDNIVMKVIMQEGNYLVDEVKASNIKQIYKVDEAIRLRDSEGGKSQVVVRFKDLPKEVYPNKDNVVVHKEAVPGDGFAKVAISFKGDKIAFTTSEGNKTYIALALIDDSKSTTSSSNNAGDISNSIEQAIESPIINKLFSYDIVTGGIIEKILFSNDDGELVVQIREEGKGALIRIYKNPKGNMVNLDLDKMFPSELYSSDVMKIDDKGIYIKVTAIEEEKTEEGIYIIDVDEMKVFKE